MTLNKIPRAGLITWHTRLTRLKLAAIAVLSFCFLEHLSFFLGTGLLLLLPWLFGVCGGCLAAVGPYSWCLAHPTLATLYLALAWLGQLQDIVRGLACLPLVAYSALRVCLFGIRTLRFEWRRYAPIDWVDAFFEPLWTDVIIGALMALGNYNWLGPFKEGVYLESIGEYLFLGYGLFVILGVPSLWAYARRRYSKVRKRWRRRGTRRYGRDGFKLFCWYFWHRQLFIYACEGRILRMLRAGFILFLLFSDGNWHLG